MTNALPLDLLREVPADDAPSNVPADLLHDVQAVLAAAIQRLRDVGWRRQPVARGRAGGMRLVDALNYASAQAKADRRVHLLTFACAAMAIELHTGTAAHGLLPDELADLYLSPDTDDARLHQLDASIIVRYNTDRCTGYSDAAALLQRAFDNAEAIIDAQLTPAGASCA